MLLPFNISNTNQVICSDWKLCIGLLALCSTLDFTRQERRKSGQCLRSISQIPDGIPHPHPTQTCTEANELKYNHFCAAAECCSCVRCAVPDTEGTLHHHRACGLLCVHHSGSAELFQETLEIFQTHSHSHTHTPQQRHRGGGGREKNKVKGRWCIICWLIHLRCTLLPGVEQWLVSADHL